MEMDKATWRSLRRLVIYMALHEGHHYEEDGKPRGHIFRDVTKVARWLGREYIAMNSNRWVLWIGRAVSLWPVYVVVSSATWKLTRNPFSICFKPRQRGLKS